MARTSHAQMYLMVSLFAAFLSCITYRQVWSTLPIVHRWTGETERGNKNWYSFRDDDAPLWCGKAYQPQWPAVDPGGRVPVPAKSERTILDVRCYSRMSTYFHGETVGKIVVDLEPTTDIYPRASSDVGHIYLEDSPMAIAISVVGVPGTRYVDVARKRPGRAIFDIDLAKYSTSHDPLGFECSIEYDSNRIDRLAEMYHVPPADPDSPKPGSFSKLDRLTNLVLVNSTTTGEPLGQWEPVVPYGFYNAPKNLSELVSLGFNVLHLVPDLPSTPGAGYGPDYASLVAEAARLGIWIMHDLRWSWQDPDLLTHQVESLRSATNLLTWYTADEADGETLDPARLQRAHDRLHALDSRHHVLSSVLNCADFEFERYSASIDVLLTDPYPVARYSYSSSSSSSYSSSSSKSSDFSSSGVTTHDGGLSIYGTVSNETYGCDGCDLCPNSVRAVARRVEEYRSHQRILDRWSAIWIVPQGLGGQLHWTRSPTRVESLAIQVLSLMHGVTGSVTWLYDDATEDIIHATSITAELVEAYAQVLFLGHKKALRLDVAGLEVTVWRNETRVLIGCVTYEAFQSQAIRLPLSGILGSNIVHHLIGTSELLLGAKGVSINGAGGLSADMWSIET